MNVGDYEDVVIDNVKYTLLHVNMTLNQEMNCQLFNSCKKTKYASQVAAMNNAVGFISFQVIILYVIKRVAKPIVNLLFLLEWTSSKKVD